MSNKIKILLTVSVILNFLFIGIFVGQFSEDFMRHKEWRGEIKNTIDKLPPEKAEIVRKTMRKLHDDTKKTRKKIRKTRKNIAKIVTSPTFNEADFDAEIDKLHKLQGEIMTYFGNATKDLASKLDHAEREVIAELLDKRKYRRHHHRHGDHDRIKPPPGLDQPPPF